jgi:ankyrin repeat protein
VVSETNNNGESALHLSVANKNVKLSCYLIKEGSNAMLADVQGRKPLQMAPDLTFERAMREAEKKQKRVLEPVLSPRQQSVIDEHKLAAINKNNNNSNNNNNNATNNTKSMYARVAGLLVEPPKAGSNLNSAGAVKCKSVQNFCFLFLIFVI